MKSGSVFENVDDYIASFPKDVRNKLELLRKTIKKAAPKAEESISYNMPAYKQNGALIYFAGYAKHIGLYPRISAFKKELDKYKGGKGTVQLPLNEPIPVKLIADMIKHQVAKNTKN